MTSSTRAGGAYSGELPNLTVVQVVMRLSG